MNNEYEVLINRLIDTMGSDVIDNLIESLTAIKMRDYKAAIKYARRADLIDR